MPTVFRRPNVARSFFVLTISLLVFVEVPSVKWGKDLSHTITVGAPAFAQTSSGSYIEGRIQIKKAYHETGKNYIVAQDFGTTPDSMNALTISKLRVFENGRELGPAHSMHADIRTLGQGRFSHWGGNDGTSSLLYFSASDSSNPRTNGRKYTYRIYLNSAPSSSPTTPTSPPPPPSPPPVTEPAPSPTEPAPAPPETMGPVFYVSPTGSDSNPGTLASPWRTIQTAALKLVAGDTAILLDGVYEEPSIVFRNSGSTDKRITIRAQNKWGAVLSSTSGCHPALSIMASYITIENIRLSVSQNNVACTTYSSANAAIRAWNINEPTPANPSTGNQGFIARGLLIDASTARDTGIKTNQDFSVIENSVVYNEIELFNGRDQIVRGNTVYSGSPNGTHIVVKGGARNSLVYNNVIHITASTAIGIYLGTQDFAYWDNATNYTAYNCVAFNNVVINEGPGTNVGLFGVSGSKDCVLANNIGVGGQIYIAPGYQGLLNVNPTFVNNILVGRAGIAATGGYNGWNGYWTGTLTLANNNFYGYSSGVPAQTNPVFGDPLLTSDYHLQAASPCLGRGQAVSPAAFEGGILDVSQNRDGIARTVPWNLGIY